MSAFDWKRYLDLARLLAEPGKFSSAADASNRSAVSRAYYAAFCAARRLARMQGANLPGGGADHVAVCLHFGQRTAKDEKSAAVTLGRLRLSRGKADYDDHVSAVDALAEKAVIEAEEVLRLLQL